MSSSLCFLSQNLVTCHQRTTLEARECCSLWQALKILIGRWMAEQIVPDSAYQPDRSQQLHKYFCLPSAWPTLCVSISSLGFSRWEFHKFPWTIEKRTLNSSALLNIYLVIQSLYNLIIIIIFLIPHKHLTLFLFPYT